MTVTAPQPTDPAEPSGREDGTAGASRAAEAVGRALATAARRPVTAVTALLLLVTGIATGAFWSPLADRPWADGVATGVPALAAGHWWTPVTAALVGVHPVGALVGLVLVVAGVGWGEGRLGSWRTAAVLVVAQLVGVLAAVGLVAALAATGWAWAVAVSAALTGGITTGVLAVLAVASATLGAPWRLRLRLVLVGVVAVGLLFLGHLADVAHLLALAVALPLGRRLAGAGEAPTGRPGRREFRLVAAAGLVVIAVIRALTLVVPVVGPLGDTASDSTVVETVISVVISLLLAEGLRRGRRIAWVAGLVLGVFYLLLALLVIGAVVYAQVTDQMDQIELVGLAVFVPNAVLWSALLVWLVAGRHAFAVPSRRRLRRRSAATGPEVAREALHRYGGSTISWMTTWPENRYLAHGSGPARGVTAYRVHAGVAVALGDPIVAPGERTAALEDFRALAERSGWVPCLFSTTEVLAE